MNMNEYYDDYLFYLSFYSFSFTKEGNEIINGFYFVRSRHYNNYQKLMAKKSKTFTKQYTKQLKCSTHEEQEKTLIHESLIIGTKVYEDISWFVILVSCQIFGWKMDTPN